MAVDTVLYDKLEHVATITLNRTEALNAFNPQLRADLLNALEAAQIDDEVRCIILTGAGRTFSAGADVKGWDRNLAERAAAPEPPSPLVVPLTTRDPILSFLRMMTTPIIVAFNGPAVGMGVTLSLSCDIRVMAESARIAFIFVKRGVTPEFGSSFLLPRLVGFGKAKELCLTGRFVGAKEAKEIGLVNEVFPDDQLMDGAMAMARSIAENPPVAVRFTKRALNHALEASMDQALEFEHWAFATCQKSDDFKESVRAFIEKRAPQYKGR